jgi:phospholipid/cholesterol/gamma-HCH transport system substrate-binding protein
MNSFGVEARVGAVVALALALLLWSTFQLKDFAFRKEEGVRLVTLFDSAAGLDKNAPVKMAGVPIGEVAELGLEDSRARVIMRIRPGVDVPKGSRASVKAAGLLGDKYVEILPGREPGVLGEGELLPQAEGAADLDTLINRFGAIADDVKAVTASLRGALGNEDGERSLKDIVTHFRNVAENLDHIVAENREGINATVAHAEEFMRALKEDGPKLVATLNRIADRLDRGEGTLGKLLTDEAAYQKLDEALASLNTVSKNLEEGKGTLGKLINDDEAYEKLNTALTGLSGTLNQIDQIRITLGGGGEVQTDTGDYRGYVNVALTPRENKSYIFEVVSDPRGKVQKTTDLVTLNPGTPAETTEEIEQISFETKVKFSLEYFRRFGDVGLRGGLIENSFGFGADYFLDDLGLKLSLQFWDFSSDDPLNERVRAKATARYSFLEYLYVQAGYDNPFNRELDTGFVGVGIAFDDDDLKYLIGSGIGRATLGD